MLKAIIVVVGIYLLFVVHLCAAGFTLRTLGLSCLKVFLGYSYFRETHVKYSNYAAIWKGVPLLYYHCCDLSSEFEFRNKGESIVKGGLPLDKSLRLCSTFRIKLPFL